MNSVCKNILKIPKIAANKKILVSRFLWIKLNPVMQIKNTRFQKRSKKIKTFIPKINPKQNQDGRYWSFL